MAFGQPESASLVIADISGYTGYLAGVELDHAQDVLADLIETMVGALRPPFNLSKLEGDAAFVYLAEPEVDGLHLQNIIESTYFEFRRRQRNIVQSSICECDACAKIRDLDLKFVVHHGQVAKQEMSGQEELVGRDVILVHRLLKNEAESRIGGRAYAMYTDAFAKASGIDPVAQDLIRHTENIDIIGEVTTWLSNLTDAWQREEERSREIITEKDAYFSFKHDFAAPRQILWDYLTSPRLRAIWSFNTTGAEEHSENGRRGPGTLIHCMHGKDMTLEEIVDWSPPSYVTRRYQMPVDGAPPFIVTQTLDELPDGGTRLTANMKKFTPQQLDGFELIRDALEEYFAESNKKLIKVVEEDAAIAQAAQAADPALPPSAGRFLSEPVIRSAH